MADEVDYDVLVIGSGAAGLCAAVAAHEQGAQRILVAESEGVVGGSSRLSGGIVMAAESRLQKEAGIQDSVEDLLHDYLTFNQYGAEPAPVATLVRRSGNTVDWMQDHGVPFAAELIRTGVERGKRGHAVLGGGQGIIDAMHRYCRKHGIEIALGRRVDRLLVRDGAVYGIAVGDDQVTARSVVVASGGFGADLQKVAEYTPSVYWDGWTWYIGADGSRGDALEMAAGVGAQLTGRGNVLRTLAPNFFPNKLNEAYQPGWAVMVDLQGRRFMDESALYAVVDQRYRHIGDRGFMIFDDAAMRPPKELADRYRSPYTESFPGREPFRPKNYQPDLVDEMVAKGRMFKADTIAGLAAAAGLPEDALTAEIENYNRFCDAGDDAAYGKPADFLLPISKAPYYIAEVRPCTVNWTSYGMRVDGDARVLHESGAEIPGLFAAGECTGGVLGRAYVGSGNSLANSCVMGRTAGEAAARNATAA
ncbi:FAD-dependent oxidoreductase [Streptomyces sp. NPDC097610]|uniref:FAD-dependent oxidoreductase n=1 Tax=Streptomyces sp. NPDC097610 TaxID=3157227 RepID=UPI003333AA9D